MISQGKKEPLEPPRFIQKPARSFKKRPGTASSHERAQSLETAQSLAAESLGTAPIEVYLGLKAVSDADSIATGQSSFNEITIRSAKRFTLDRFGEIPEEVTGFTVVLNGPSGKYCRWSGSIQSGASEVASNTTASTT